MRGNTENVSPALKEGICGKRAVRTGVLLCYWDDCMASLLLTMDKGGDGTGKMIVRSTRRTTAK